MFYTVYKITNNVNGKFYIGKHQTKDLNDGYMGSGNLIKRAIKKHGIDNFTKEILEVFQTEEEMNEAEKRLVVLSEDTYNICPGGKGGFGYINENLQNGFLNKKHTNEYKNQKSVTMKELRKNEEYRFIASRTSFLGKNHTENTKRKIGMANSKNIGPKSSQYGTCWITNGTENKKIKKETLDKWMEIGYYRGRINPGW